MKNIGEVASDMATTVKTIANDTATVLERAISSAAVMRVKGSHAVSSDDQDSGMCRALASPFRPHKPSGHGFTDATIVTRHI